ncbi:MAG: hypothetical protein HYW38_00750, partial [Candidatus Colwellbacteria bacterium]|nr:hypothetical protein [Candidatus Colwellbacteria bacterium]
MPEMKNPQLRGFFILWIIWDYQRLLPPPPKPRLPRSNPRPPPPASLGRAS